MLDVKEIQEEIKKLESGKTNHDTCFKLSYLYTVLDHIQPQQDESVPPSVPETIQSARALVEMDTPLTQTPTLESVENCTIQNGDLSFCNLVNAKGSKRILEGMAKYMQHLRAYQPAQYSRIMDKLSIS